MSDLVCEVRQCEPSLPQAIDSLQQLLRSRNHILACHGKILESTDPDVLSWIWLLSDTRIFWSSVRCTQRLYEIVGGTIWQEQPLQEHAQNPVRSFDRTSLRVSFCGYVSQYNIWLCSRSSHVGLFKLLIAMHLPIWNWRARSSTELICHRFQWVYEVRGFTTWHYFSDALSTTAINSV